MAIAYTVYPERQFIEIRLTGAVALSDIEALCERQANDLAYRLEYNTLTDLREMTNVLSTDEIKQLAGRVDRGRLESKARRAIVVSSDLAYGRQRMFQGFTGGDTSPFRIFRTLEEARQWLGIGER